MLALAELVRVEAKCEPRHSGCTKSLNRGRALHGRMLASHVVSETGESTADLEELWLRLNHMVFE